MKYRFPNIDKVQRHLLSCAYQEEEFQYLYIPNVNKIKSFLKRSIDDDFILREIKTYNQDGYLDIQEIYNSLGETEEVRKFEYMSNKITSEYKEQNIQWHFNSEGYLIKEEHKYQYDGPTVYNFKLDSQGNLLKVNDIQFVKTDGITSSIIATETNLGEPYRNIIYDKQKQTLKFGKDTHQNILHLNKEGKVTKRINSNRIVETEYKDNGNWNSYVTLLDKKYLNYKKQTSTVGKQKLTIETKLLENGQIEYEFKEICYQK